MLVLVKSIQILTVLTHFRHHFRVNPLRLDIDLFNKGFQQMPKFLVPQKTSGQRPQNLPEPMSTTSRNTFMRRPQSSVQPMSTRSICPQFNNYSYQPHNSQNFISEELNFTHNVDQQTEQLNSPCLQQQNTDYDYECLQNEQTFTVYHAAQILAVT